MTLLQASALAADSVSAKVSSDINELKSLSVDDLIHRIANGAVDLCIKIALAILVFYVGKFIIKRIYGLVQSIMERRNTDTSLSTFILSLVKIVLYFILIVTIIGVLGLETGSFLAIFASAGVAIGMALSGTLQNFAGGVLILLLKPYKIGDYIEAQGFSGKVTEIQIFHTIINTPDNKSILIPNGGLSTGSINNWSREEYRRVDWVVAISYGDDVNVARDTILTLFANDSRIVIQSNEDDRVARRQRLIALATHDEIPPEALIQAPKTHTSWLGRLFRNKKKLRQAAQRIGLERARQVRRNKTDLSPSVIVNQLADSSVELKARAWVRSGDYWAVFYEFNELIYTELPKAGISFPFPQLDVHLPSAN
ncbi:MAG: mechanosensitive ion channel [Muribaculaceae bacterium]|nr:mechanosensitive ion channel [Muribaculaceae bacterium]